ncbi:hypothetical protein GDO78_015949 [Eleutherodactylus coqui]|uniref:Uncharacterized protein n=1 Tax=Eleutherodactylus coqui TaxID=57060 RepID=A0A8J6ED22_ELECQ|nr:hypothetical protein GDO78_015949 [Eleutherodactylus coqui]
MDLIALLVSVVVILFLVNAFKNQKQGNYKNFPPGPRPLPIIGNVHQMDIDKPYRTFMELAKEYGTVFSFHLGMSKTVVLCGYETIKDALLNHAEIFSERPDTPMFTAAMKGHGKPFDNATNINAAVTNIIVSILLSKRFDSEDPTILRLMGLVNQNVKLFSSPAVVLYNSYPSLAKWLPGAHEKILENFKGLQDFIKATFTKQKQELDINDQRNLIDAFLAKQQEGKTESTNYFHNENLISLVVDLFAAGMETTSTTLRWAVLLMMKYPEIQQKVQSEIEQVIGSTHPQMEHRKQMPYTDAVIHEIMRFGDIAPAAVPHSPTQDITFRGYFIPKGTTVIPLLHSALRDEAYFEKPYEFYPEHFLDSAGNFRKNEAFVPFSIGKRSCAGETLAKMELFLFFTSLLQNFTFHPTPGAELDLTPTLGSANAPEPYEICAVSRR